jgi:hypothetical protein
MELPKDIHMPINILGPCRPRPAGKCIDPLDPNALASIVDSLPITGREGNVNLIVPGQIEIPWPSKLGRTIVSVVSHPDNKRYGLFHLPELKTIWINSTTLQKVVDLGLFRPGNYYYQLIYSINAIGLEAVDIEYILPNDDTL